MDSGFQLNDEKTVLIFFSVPESHEGFASRFICRHFQAAGISRQQFPDVVLFYIQE